MINENCAIGPCRIAAGAISLAILNALLGASDTNGIKVTAVSAVGVHCANSDPVMTLGIDVAVQWHNAAVLLKIHNKAP
jgi:hypothetical protein